MSAFALPPSAPLAKVELKSSYDAFPYESFAFPQTHPDGLATLGWLFGMAPVPIGAARVLEIGCASGGNVIPMAASLPGSEFVGVDFSEVQIRRGAADVAALGLRNISLLGMDIAQFDESHGRFDYIIAHGVYSWVPNDVQERILALCARQLAPNGIAYISYNTLPGWGMRGVVRAAMRYHTRQFSDPATRVAQARAMLDFLAEAVTSDTSAHGVMLRTEADAVRKQPDYYILHDHLEEVNEPLYFHQFIERATRHRLRYLGEANFHTMLTAGFAPPVAQTLDRIAPDLLKREQFMDFLRNRMFRQTLLVHEDVVLERKISMLRVEALHVASRARATREPVDLQGDGLDEFRMPDGNALSTGHRLTKAAMQVLADRWPEAVSFDALAEAAAARAAQRAAPDATEQQQLAATLLNCFAAGVVELHGAPSPFVTVAGAMPEAGAVPRLQAERGPRVTSLRHEPITVDPETRRLLPLLDGTRHHAAIAASAWPGEAPDDARRRLDLALVQVGRQALLVR